MRKLFLILPLFFQAIICFSQASVQDGNKLVGTGSFGGPTEGYSVALSSDGNTAIVGGISDNQSVGAVWVFIRINGVWVQQGDKLVGAGGIGQTDQGASVSLSADGNTAIVGAPIDNKHQGAVWIFTRNNGVWTQQGDKLVGKGGVGQSDQGSSVCLSADGNTAIVGGVSDSSGQGAAWVYIRSGGVWFQQGDKLVGTGSVVNVPKQGKSVSISADGNTAAVSGYADNDNLGAVWVYTRTNGTWRQQGNKLVGTGSIGTYILQGSSVSLSADGNTIIVGAFGDNNFQGASWIFSRLNDVWTQQGGKLVGLGSDGVSRQGYSVSISSDGNNAVVGGPYDNNNQGAMWLFSRSNGVWTQNGNKLVGKDNVGAAYQGFSVSINAEGDRAIESGYGDDTYHGAAWMFTIKKTSVPFRFVNISNKKEGNVFTILWEVASPQQIKKYTLARSSDGLNFTNIGSVTGSYLNTYSFNDTPQNYGTYFYRIQAVDISDQYFYSDTLKVVYGDEVAKISIFPNPVVTRSFTVSFENQSTNVNEFSIINDAGATIYHKTFMQTIYTNKILITLPQNIPKGAYQLIIIGTDKFTKTVKFLYQG